MKILEFFKKNYKNILINIGIYILILFLVIPIVLNKGIGNLDELWNYNFARNVANGLVPYKDFNMVQTPLLPLVLGMILKIFTNELIITRIVAILLNAGIFYVLYKIFLKIGINKKVTTLILLILLGITGEYLCIDYNYCTLLLLLIIIYLELKKHDETTNKIDAIIGFLAGCTIMLKQSTGLIIAIATLGYQIIFIRNKRQFKEFFKMSFARLLFMIIPIICILLYLGFNNALVEFIDYAILGVSTFSNSIPYSNLIHSDKMIISMLSIIIPITMAISYLYSLMRCKKVLNMLTIYSIAMFCVTFPISDTIHFYIGIVPGIILSIYVLSKLFKFLKEKIKQKVTGKLRNVCIYLEIFIDTFIKLICVVYISLYLIDSIRFVTEYVPKSKQYTDLNHFKYIEVSEGQYRMIKNIGDYIIFNNINDVYILDSDAALYMIPIDRYNKGYDMFLKGNLGSKGEDGQIEKIKQMEKNTKILIKNNNYSRNWQNPNTVTEYIKNNLEKIGEIEYFDIYVK